MTRLINLGVHQQGALSISSKPKTDIPTQTINENSVQESKAEKPHPGHAEIRAIQNQTQGTAGSQAIPPAPLIRQVRTTSSAFIKKYEMGSGKDKINACIFKEPPAEPVTLEPEKDSDTKQGEADTLVLRLKKELVEIPIQPSEPIASKEKINLEE